MVTVIGDVHGKVEEYLKIVKGSECSVQVGDMGFDYSHIHKLDPNKHTFFKGNHDNYTWFMRNSDPLLNDLGDFGPRTVGGIGFFFVRGGHSLDVGQRIPYYNYWPEEQLRYSDFEECLKQYRQTRPSIVLSHEAPVSALSMFPDKRTLKKFGYHNNWVSSTAVFLDALFHAHHPKLWVFGHMHSSRDQNIEGTRFVCLKELETFEIV